MTPEWELPAGLAGDLVAEPAELDLGRAEVDCPIDGVLTLTNQGTVALEPTSIAQVGADFSHDFEVPVTLGPGESTDIDVLGVAPELGDIEGELWIASSVQDLRVPQLLEGTSPDDTVEYVHEWTVPELDRMDIVLIVDRTGSMERDTEAMLDAAPLFLQYLDTADADWLLAVVTADNGCHNIDVIDDVDQTDLLRQAAEGSGGLFSEAGLTLAKHALAWDRRVGCNSSVFRDGATPHVVIVSDEADQSPSSNGYAYVVPEYWDTSPWTRLHVVVGDVPEGCSYAGNEAKAGHGYVEAAELTQGSIHAICTDAWGDVFRDVRGAMFEPAAAEHFPLATGELVMETLTVSVDGEEVEFAYDDEWLSVLPLVELEPGQIVRVEYATAMTCD
ncbi:MAG: hypothetical protein GY913_14660 [Proteobacteria bacterium]|nr:hypothetical protein [Pseudomonadota bacterium]